MMKKLSVCSSCCPATARYKTMSACSGEEGLRLFSAHSGEIDLVISDVVVPEISGYKMVERIRSSRPDVPVLFITGAMQDDFDYYIVIIAGRYGSIGRDGKSYTQMEYEYAGQLGPKNRSRAGEDTIRCAPEQTMTCLSAATIRPYWRPAP